jgi:hypothetical protein
MAFFLIDNQNQITRTNRLVITAEGIATPRGSKNPLFLEGIYEAEEAKALTRSQREAALVEITLVQIEYLARRFLKERKLSNEQLGRITIYGSSSLTLTILPNRISHDVDVAVSKDFREFIDAVCSNERPALGQLEINTANPIVLRFCGNYQQRRLDETSGVALALKTGVPTYQVEDEEGRTHLLIQLAIEEEDEDRWWLPKTPRFRQPCDGLSGCPKIRVTVKPFLMASLMS